MELRKKVPSREDLGHREVIILGLLVFLGSGFVFAGIINFVFSESQFCSLMGCPCGQFENGEIECNSCSSTEFKYHLGVFWISQNCESTEIIMCEDGQPTDQYYRDEGCGDYEFGNIFASDSLQQILRSL